MTLETIRVLSVISIPLFLGAAVVIMMLWYRAEQQDRRAGLTPGRQRALSELFDIWVMAAEQKYGTEPGMGPYKHEYVHQQFKKWVTYSGVQLSPSKVDAHILAAVYRLKNTGVSGSPLDTLKTVSVTYAEAGPTTEDCE